MAGLFLGIGSVMDIKRREIPLLLLGAFAVSGIVAQLIGGYAAVSQWLGGGVAGLLLVGIGRLTGESIGYGDGLAASVLGIWLGVFALIEILFLALMLSAVLAGYLFLVKKVGGKYRIPFLPFLMASYLIWLAVGMKEVAG